MEVYKMKTILTKASKWVLCLAVLVSTAAVNSTCWYKLYQEELPEELDKLKKHE